MGLELFHPHICAVRFQCCNVTFYQIVHEIVCDMLDDGTIRPRDVDL